MRAIPPSVADPGRIMSETGNLVQTVYLDTSAKTPRSVQLNGGERTLILFIPGQSLNSGISGSPYTPGYGGKIDNYLWTNGQNFAASDGLVGTQWSGAGNGANFNLRVADGMISNGRFGRVILVPCAISGTSVAYHANDYYGSEPAGYYRMMNAAAIKLASQGIVPGMPNVEFAVKWNQGESDTQQSTTQANYVADFMKMYGQCHPIIRSAKWFIAQESWYIGSISNAVRAAQAQLVNNMTFFSGGDMDTIGSGGRQGDNTHLNDTGAAAAATIGVNALSAVY